MTGFPGHVPLSGRWARLEPVSLSHLEELWSVCADETGSFAHTRYGPYSSKDALAAQLEDFAARAHQPFWVVRPAVSGRSEGWLSICDVDTEVGALEIGAVWYSPALQQTAAATEAIYLLMHHAFDTCGYRRVVWRCFSHNAASLRAARRFGFTPEGVWRDGGILDGIPRDVAWHSMLAAEWPGHRARFQTWLAPDNFTGDGLARRALSDIQAG